MCVCCAIAPVLTDKKHCTSLFNQHCLCKSSFDMYFWPLDQKERDSDLILTILFPLGKKKGKIRGKNKSNAQKNVFQYIV